MATSDRKQQRGERIRAVINAKTDNFIELLEIAGLDRRKHLRYADWSGVDFSGCDLTGCDFTGARLHACKFDGTLIAGRPAVADLMRAGDSLGGTRSAIFDQAELGAVIHRPGRDPHSPAEMTGVADLTKAADWNDYADPKRWPRDAELRQRRLSSDAHLPTGAIFQDAPFAPQLVVLPAGAFMMGSTEDERNAEERPQRRVTIAKRIAVGRFAVTFDEWNAFVATGGTKHRPEDMGWGRERRPVINVSWDDAVAYARWLSDATGRDYCLPSEAEWEYCCRAGTTTAYSFGDMITKAQAQFSEGEGGSAKQTVDVGSFAPNAFGLYDMHGNVWEWCEDNWHENYEGNPPTDGSVWKGGDGSLRVLRGGSWYIIPRNLRAADRRRRLPDDRGRNNGFRLARTLDL